MGVIYGSTSKKAPEKYLEKMEDVYNRKEQLSYEEVMLYGMVIGYAGFDLEKRRYWLDHFINEMYIDSILECCHNRREEAYYIQMAAAWTISICYMKFPEQTKKSLLEGKFIDAVHNKAIQKICESTRFTKEEKAVIRTWKRKKERV